MCRRKKYVKSMSMSTASKLRGTADSADVGVSVDGTWHRKVLTSLSGAMTAISINSGKAVDTAILSKSCKVCIRMQTIKTKDPHAYDKWNEAYKCRLITKAHPLR